MSLFKTREWWTATCGTGEEFDHGCLAMGNLDEAPDGGVKIVTGSFSGLVRVHAPKDRDYKVDDLVLEMDLKVPIIQVEVGRFVSHAGKTSLAVLHPRKLAVYTLATTGGASAYHQLSLEYEHRLEHTASNMVFGQFGGAPADIICVQSMDGQLCVFEQETLAFARYLPNFLIPGPLAYCRQMDALLTCNSCFEVECYKYQVLASSSADRLRDGERSESGGLTATKKVQVDWKLCVGEAAVQIATTMNFSAPNGSGAAETNGQRAGGNGGEPHSLNPQSSPGTLTV
jgi:Bardet-Biedl syndrome 9 protein